MPEKVISIPATAAFSQFSGIAIRGNKMLIASQVNLLLSQIFLWSCYQSTGPSASAVKAYMLGTTSMQAYILLACVSC